MSKDIRIISAHELLPYAHELIRMGHKVRITVSGNSMRPFIVHNRDQVVVSEASCVRKGDIILFRNLLGEYTLHRIYQIDSLHCRTIGDFCLKEDGQVELSEIIGVVEQIERKGKVIRCGSWRWKFLFRIWTGLLPFRKYLIQLYLFCIKIKAKIKNNI